MAYAGRVEVESGLGARLRRARDAAAGHPEAFVASGLVVGFIAISAWWVSVDARIPNGDNGKHIIHAFQYLGEFQNGHWLAPLFVYTQYPPLVHVVGAVGAAIGGASVESVILAENLVFVPLLALGTYKAAALAFGRFAGLLAVVFVLAAPMVMSLFHVFMLDAPAAALAAVSVWLMLASRRFASLPYSIAAAVAIAAGLYVKTTFILFVAGLGLALIARGGWRQWRNVAVAMGVLLILVEPWYFIHFNDIRGLTTGAINQQTALWYGGVPYPSRWSLDNFSWYGWNLLNNQVYLPLFLFFLVGVGVAVVRWTRNRSGSYVPELLVGMVVGYLGISLISLDDPRYSLPLLVYVAVFATGWIPSLPTWGRTAAGIGLALVLVVNTALLNFTGGDIHGRLKLPGAPNSPIGEREMTFFSNRGYIEGRPDPDGVTPRFVDLLKRARGDGARQVVFQPESMNNGGYNLFGLTIFARMADLQVPGFQAEMLGPEDVFVFRLHPDQVGQPPCLLSWDGTGIYMYKGQPSADKPTYCPPA